MVEIVIRRNSKNPLSLIQNISWTLASNIIYAVCQWGVLIAIIKLGNVHLAGQFTYALAVVTPVVLFCNLHLRAVITTDIQNRYTFADYVKTRLWSISVVIISFACLFLVPVISLETKLVIFFMTLVKAIDSLSDIYHGLFQREERMDIPAKSLLIKGPLFLLGASITLWIVDSIVVLLTVQVLIFLMVFVFYERRQTYQFVFIPEVKESQGSYHNIKSIVKQSFPLGILMVIIAFNDNLSRYFINHHLGLVILGYFSSISYFRIAGNTFINAMGQSASARLAKYYQLNQKKAFRNLLGRLLLATGLLSLLAYGFVVIAGDQLLVLVYNESYREFHNLFILVIIGAGIDYVGSILGYAITSCRAFNSMPIYYGSLLMINILLCAMLIPRFGIEGAVYATISVGLIKVLLGLLLLLGLLRKNKNSHVEGGSPISD